MSAQRPQQSPNDRWLALLCAGLTSLLLFLAAADSRAILPASFYRAVSPRTVTGGILQLDLNTASAAALEEISGIGPALAERIVEYRAANGPYRTVEGLLEVSGIGPATLEKIRPYLTV